MKPQVIALYSSAPQMGKSTVADYLVQEYGFTRVKFAQTLKDVASVLLSAVGYKQVDIHAMLEGDRKEMDCAFFGMTPRELLVSLGTDWGRQMVHKDIWARIGVAEVQSHISYGGCVVVDDMRFPNEYELLRAMSLREGIPLKMVRIHKGERIHPDWPTQPSSTEGLLNKLKWDRAIIAREGDITTLHKRAGELVDHEH